MLLPWHTLHMIAPGSEGTLNVWSNKKHPANAGKSAGKAQ